MINELLFGLAPYIKKVRSEPNLFDVGLVVIFGFYLLYSELFMISFVLSQPN